MANPEHLKILRQGVETWNKWREENPGIRADLSRVNLHKANLVSAYFRGACLQEADLSKANLQWANLSEADCKSANASEAKLTSVDAWKVNLTNADLNKAVFQAADLRRAHLRNTGLYKAILRGSNLSKADLTNADLYRAALDRADLHGARLCNAVLIETNLVQANLVGANFEKANLEDADFRGGRLVSSNLTGAILTGAKLHGTARDEWIIKGVKCDYMYWDAKGEQRSPRDRDLEPGEFERLYAALPTIEYIFEHGISPLDPLIMDRVVQAIHERRPEFDIKIDSINARGLAPSIKFTVKHEEHKEPAIQEVRKGYETKLKQLESERDRYYQLVSRALDAPREVKLITAGPGAIVATDGSTVNIQQHIHNALELQKAIADEPKDSKSFAKVAQKTALDIIGGAIKDITKGQVKEAAKQIIELGKDLGPIIAKTAAYAFFKNLFT